MTTFGTAALAKEKPNKLVLLLIKELTDAVSDFGSGTLVPYVGLLIAIVPAPVSCTVEERDAAEDAVLGPESNHVGNAIWIVLGGGKPTVYE